MTIMRVLFVVMMLMVSGSSSQKITNRKADKPYNVLYFVADDLRPEFLSAYGQNLKTPNLDKLADEGLVFIHAYCSVAVCGPSRNSFMTGRRPHHTLVFDNSGSNFRANGQGTTWNTLPEHFKNNNYTTLGGGKTFHPDNPKNWDEPRSWSQDMPYFPFQYSLGKCPGVGKPNNRSTSCSDIDTWCAMDGPDSQFYDHTLANNTIDRLRYVTSIDKPWFVQSGFARPHAPWRVPQRFWDMYSDDLPLATHRNTIENMAGVAWHQQGFYNATNGDVFIPKIDDPIPDEIQRSVRRAYYSSVSWIDFQIGRIVAELDLLGQTDNTIVLLHGDHGWQLGEHNDFHKQTNFELATRVPLIIKAPGKPNSWGKRTLVFAELVDVYPTLSALAGINPPIDVLDGASLVPAFDDPTIIAIPNAVTYNKTVAYTQYPGQYFSGCLTGYVRKNGTECVNSSGVFRMQERMYSDSDDSDHSKQQYYMGFGVRSHDWRYSVWIPCTVNNDNTSLPALICDWKATASTNPPRLTELYDHRGDNGSDFNWVGNNINVGLEPANAAVIMAMHGQAQHLFLDVMPPNHPKVPPPPPPPACNDGWVSYPNSFCKGKGETTTHRYFYHGNETIQDCKDKCKSFNNCMCLDYGLIKGFHWYGNCHLQGETQQLTNSGLGLEAFIPC